MRTAAKTASAFLLKASLMDVIIYSNIQYFRKRKELYEY